MNPPEGAAEEGGAADSDVDAFFRTGKPGQGAGAGGEGCCPGRGVSDKFGEGRLLLGSACWGAVPRGRRGWSCGDSSCYGSGGCVLGRAWGLGARAPRRSPQLRESVLGRREAVPSGRLLPERGDGAMLDHFAARRSSYRSLRPLPRLPPSPVPVSLASGRPGPAPLLRPGPWALMCNEGQWGPGDAQSAD